MIGIKGMELPKGCIVCPIKDSCKSIKEHQDEYNKFLEYYTGYDNRFAWCNLIDLGKEDLSWDELVEKVGKYKNTIRISSDKFDFIIGDYLVFYKTGRITLMGAIINEHIKPYQMYQIIKSLVGDER